MKTFFISGTNTGIGKTVAAAWLCRELSQRGRCVYVKAVQTGAIIPADGGPLVAADLEFVKASAPDLIVGTCLQLFRLAASPHLAAAREDSTLNKNELASSAKEFALNAKADFLVVEGAGGLMVPLNEKDDMADLSLSLEARLIIVASTGLGTLNHCKLSLFYATAKGCESPLLILNRLSKENPLIENDNIALLKEDFGGRLLSLLPLQPELDTERDSLPDDFAADQVSPELLFH